MSAIHDPDTGFDARMYLPRALYEAVSDIRVRHPNFAEEEAGRRARRRVLAPAGRLIILAADHAVGSNLRIQDDPLAMGDRRQFLARILRVLSHPAIDGVVSTPDIVEDLLILSGLLRERGGQSPLDERVVIGCMNRGRLPGTVWETDDRLTAFTARRLIVLRMDGGKVTIRLDPTDAGSPNTVDGCVRAVGELAEAGLGVFVEPLPVVREQGAHRVHHAAPALAGVASAASAMGASSLYTWLKLPTCPGFEAVAAATTLPILVLPGESAGDPRPVLDDLWKALRTGANVRGAVIGRSVLFPGADDPRAMAAAAAAVVHEGVDVEKAVAAMDAERGREPELT